MGNGPTAEGATVGIAGKGKSTAAIYGSTLILDLLHLRLSDFLNS